MMSCKPLPAAAIVCLCLGIPSFSGGQTVPPPAETTLRAARTRYYTPVDNGLQSFRCDVSFDWKDFIQKASNQPVPEGDARLKYLRSIRLSVEDSLRGSGELQWDAPTPPPADSEESVGRIRVGMQQVWSAFFQSWNGYFTGDLVTVDSSATVVSTPDGFHVAVHTGSSVAEEQFDHSLLLKSVHVATPTLDSTVVPTFSHGPQGLLVNAIESTYRQPPSAAPTSVHMEISYATVNGFQLPSELIVAAGPATFDYHLANCTAQAQITPR